MNLKGVYQHHGIDCGDGTVIHYRKPSEIVERTSFEVFSRGNPVYVLQYTDGFCFISDVVVSRAESRLDERKYNLLFNNCEHFATWCKTGISESVQIKDFVPIIAHLKTVGLYKPLKEALIGADPSNARTLLQGALGDIKLVWDDLQPRYKIALKEIETWNKVATEAIKKNREDLAKEALRRKVDYKKQAKNLKDELDQLAIMAENVIKNLLIANQVG